MTVKELKQYLEHCPDDMEIIILNIEYRYYSTLTNRFQLSITEYEPNRFELVAAIDAEGSNWSKDQVAEAKHKIDKFFTSEKYREDLKKDGQKLFEYYKELGEDNG